ncbi:hypothetical protein IWX65_000608 [Arthrobacter sp. CAN_A214]|uniref:S1C family serine protease n=1 Tax=Arthrobacter sp. CAN_A214 TaxID=2787720 RepID=UPI001A2BE97F
MTIEDARSVDARLPAMAGAALATLLVAGCSSADSTGSAELNGADAQVNVVEMEDLYLVALEEGEPARFLGTLINQSAFPMDVTLSDADHEVVVTVPADSEFAFADGQRVSGTVEATDVVSDLALVRADRTGLPAAEFETDLPRTGETAIVIGSPLGFENTVTAGIISGLHREIPGSARTSQSLVDLIQTDAPISPGNSGGAVVNGQGKIIGISEAYIPPQSGAVALGFAIPAATAVEVAEQLLEDGTAEHAFLGLVPGAITAQIAQQLGLESPRVQSCCPSRTAALLTTQEYAPVTSSSRWPPSRSAVGTTREDGLLLRDLCTAGGCRRRIQAGSVGSSC